MGVAQNRSGLLSFIKNMATLLLTSGKTRLELLGNEIEEEKLRIIHLFLLAQGLTFCFGAFTFFVAAFFTVLFWDNRGLVFGIFALAFLVGGLALLSSFKRVTRRPNHIFEDSLAALGEDIRQLKEAIGHDSQKTE